LTRVNDCSQPGSVLAGTKMLVPNVSGNMIRNTIPCTDPGVRASMPISTEIQLRHSANAITIRQAASTSGALVWARKPST
jgi:hypothetical protein